MTMNRRKFCESIPLLPVLPTIFSSEKFLYLLPQKTKTLNQGHTRLNQSAEFILYMCDGKTNIFEIADTYRKNFGISLVTAINDSINTLTYFNSIGIIKFR